MKKGKFIIIEGPDFCGKSTQISIFKNSDDHKKNMFTREPGSYLPKTTEYCENIREKILSSNLTAYQEAILFSEVRYVHTKEIIELINKGFNVITDRYIVSSLAYQGYAQNLGIEEILKINNPVLELLKEAGITIECVKFIIDEKEWRKRRASRLSKESADTIEQKDIHESILTFFTDENIFYACTNKLDMNVYEIDASGDVRSVYQDFYLIMNFILNK